jgi:hypothetical protein
MTMPFFMPEAVGTCGDVGTCRAPKLSFTLPDFVGTWSICGDVVGTKKTPSPHGITHNNHILYVFVGTCGDLLLTYVCARAPARAHDDLEGILVPTSPHKARKEGVTSRNHSGVVRGDLIPASPHAPSEAS